MMDKETIKEFLKPTKGKIVVFVFVIIMANFPPIGGFPDEVLPGGGPSYIGYTPNMFFWLFATSYLFEYTPFFIDPFLRANGFGLAQTMLKFIWIFPIYWYILSCLTVFVYDKLKTKKQ